MATVKEMLDRLASGRATLDEVAADFATRSWPVGKPSTDAQAWGVEDADVPDTNSWDEVNTDPRLSGAEYAALAKAMEQSVSR